MMARAHSFFDRLTAVLFTCTAGCLAAAAVQGLAGICAALGMACTALAAVFYVLRYLQPDWRPLRTRPFSSDLLLVGLVVIPSTLASVDIGRSALVSLMVFLVYFAFAAAREAYSAEDGGICATRFFALVVAAGSVLAVVLRFAAHCLYYTDSVLPWFSLAPGDGGSRARFLDHIFSFLMVVSFPLLFAIGAGAVSRLRYFFLACSVFPALGSVLAFSRAAWIALACEVVLFGLLKIVRRRTALAVGLVGIVIWAVVPGSLERAGTIMATQRGTNIQRLEQWAVAYQMIARSPFLGHGPGTYTAVYKTMRGAAQNRAYPCPHNVYLHIAAECGLPAFFLFVGGLYHIFGSLWARARRPGNQPAAVFERCLRLGMIVALAGGLVFGLFDL